RTLPGARGEREAMSAELVDAEDHPFEEGAVADQDSGRVCSDVSRHGGHEVDGRVCRQPLTDAGRALADRGDADWDMVPAIEGIAEGWGEAAFVTIVLDA